MQEIMLLQHANNWSIFLINFIIDYTLQSFIPLLLANHLIYSMYLTTTYLVKSRNGVKRGWCVPYLTPKRQKGCFDRPSAQGCITAERIPQFQRVLIRPLSTHYRPIMNKTSKKKVTFMQIISAIKSSLLPFAKQKLQSSTIQAMPIDIRRFHDKTDCKVPR